MQDIVWWKWILGAFCAFNIGVAKTGMPGIGILAVPLFVLTVDDARLSAGWLLPILISADLYAIVAYRRLAATGQLFYLLPSVVVGLVLGAFALAWPESLLRRIVGAIVLAMVTLYLIRRRNPHFLIRQAWWYSAFFGTSAGFSTMVANAAGPVMNVYLLSKRLPREEFVATGAWFFFIVNLSKVPVYAWRGLISQRSLEFDAMLVPFALAGAWTGRHYIHRIPQDVFDRAVIVLAGAAAIALLVR
ncbi:MAG: sulfite exporter TauE/SafE family protein [Acidobacteria bacterium]|nr:sulfite exporter TauE/SafE family protein [Acidobacteriota bacterium]